MKMKLQLVNKNNRITFEGVLQSGIANSKTLCQIAQQSNQTFFPIRELQKVECFSVLLYGNAKWLFCNMQLTKFRNNCADSIVDSFYLLCLPLNIWIKSS